MAIRVLTVDDSILFRTVIKNEFAKISDIEIIDTAANTREAEGSSGGLSGTSSPLTTNCVVAVTPLTVT